MNSISGAHRSKPPTSNGGRGVQKDLLVEKVAEKLALLGDSRPNLSGKFTNQNNNVGDDVNNVEILRKAFGDDHYLVSKEVKRGREDFFSQEESQPNRRGEKVADRGSNASDFFENNVEIFRRAFGDSHYLVKAGRKGLFSNSNDQMRAFPCQNKKEEFREKANSSIADGFSRSELVDKPNVE